MSRPLPLRVARSRVLMLLAGTGLAAAVGLCVPAVAAVPGTGVTFQWVGSTIRHHADNHSWTDARNWEPVGVPGDGDAVTISPVGTPCRATVDAVPDGVALDDLAITGPQSCAVSLTGGSLVVSNDFTWDAGVLATPVTLALGATGLIRGDDHGAFDQELSAPLEVAGRLELSGTGLHIDAGVALTIQGDAQLVVSLASTVSGPGCCDHAARLVNHGLVTLPSTSLLDTAGLVFDQQGTVQVAQSSFLVSRDTHILAAAGSLYAGAGRWAISNGSTFTLSGAQVMSQGFHLELGNDGTSPSRLTGFGSLDGHGELDWTGGSISANIRFGSGVRFHAYGVRTGVGRRVLSGPLLGFEGSVTFDQGADVTMTHHAVIGLSDSARLTLAPGSDVLGRTTSGDPDAIFTSGTLIDVPADGDEDAPASIENVELYTEGGPVRIAPDSQLRVVGSVRSVLAFNVFKGGGVMNVAAPVDTISELDFADDTTLALTPGGSLDGGTLYAGDGRLDWTGGHVSGSASFDLSAVVVRGPDVKSVVANEGGGESFAQMLGPVTFASGRPAEHNVLDLNGNSLITFQGAWIGHDVELADGSFANSTSPLTVDPGAGHTAYTDATLHLFSSGTLDIASGRFAVSGPFTDNADTTVAAGATLQLTSGDHPLELEGGSLSGAGRVQGVVLNSGGVLEPLSPSGPLTLRGSYSQTPGGRLVLALTAGSPPLRMRGSFVLHGDVVYADAAGYTPHVGDVRRLVGADVDFDWRPGCEQTTGPGSRRGHWSSTADLDSVSATFVRGVGETCPGVRG